MKSLGPPLVSAAIAHSPAASPEYRRGRYMHKLIGQPRLANAGVKLIDNAMFRPAVEAVLKREPDRAHEQDAGATSAHSRPEPPRVDSTRTQAPFGSRLCSLL